MKIEELEGVDRTREDEAQTRHIVRVDAKRVLVGAGARILFYPTLLYNVFRNKIQPEFRWWDEVDQVFVQSFIKVYMFVISSMFNFSFGVNDLLSSCLGLHASYHLVRFSAPFNF